MAGYTGSIYTGPDRVSGNWDDIHGEDYTTGTITTTFYTMRAVDNNAGTTPPTYRVWKVTDKPDYDVSRYDGSYSGGSINFSSVVIMDITKITQ